MCCSPSRGANPRIASIALPLLALLLSFSLRLHQLGGQPVWSDEVYSIAVARHSVAEAAGWVYQDNHPALYWLLLCPVVHQSGDGDPCTPFLPNDTYRLYVGLYEPEPGGRRLPIVSNGQLLPERRLLLRTLTTSAAKDRK